MQTRRNVKLRIGAKYDKVLLFIFDLELMWFENS